MKDIEGQGNIVGCISLQAFRGVGAHSSVIEVRELHCGGRGPLSSLKERSLRQYSRKQTVEELQSKSCEGVQTTRIL